MSEAAGSEPSALPHPESASHRPPAAPAIVADCASQAADAWPQKRPTTKPHPGTGPQLVRRLATAEMGPLISKKQLDAVQAYLTEPVAFTGSAPTGAGYWMAPTVLLPKDTRSKSWNEEIFGPVVSVMTFDDEADAIAKANDTEFGLSGSIWTNNSGKAIRVARAVESGNLSVNSNSSVRYWTPFGGYKQSGLGRELGPDALDSFTEVKNVFIATDN